MKKIRTLETMIEESSWPSRSRWKARVGYGEGFLETRSVGNSIRENMMNDGVKKKKKKEMTALFALIYSSFHAIIDDSSKEVKIWREDRAYLT